MKAKTRKEALKIQIDLLKNGKSASIYKFYGKRKYKYFIGNWWQWLSAIS